MQCSPIQQRRLVPGIWEHSQTQKVLLGKFRTIDRWLPGPEAQRLKTLFMAMEKIVRRAWFRNWICSVVSNLGTQLGIGHLVQAGVHTLHTLSHVWISEACWPSRCPSHYSVRTQNPGTSRKHRRNLDEAFIFLSRNQTNTVRGR